MFKQVFDNTYLTFFSSSLNSICCSLRSTDDRHTRDCIIIFLEKKTYLIPNLKIFLLNLLVDFSNSKSKQLMTHLVFLSEFLVSLIKIATLSFPHEFFDFVLLLFFHFFSTILIDFHVRWDDFLWWIIELFLSINFFFEIYHYFF